MLNRSRVIHGSSLQSVNQVGASSRAIPARFFRGQRGRPRSSADVGRFHKVVPQNACGTTFASAPPFATGKLFHRTCVEQLCAAASSAAAAETGRNHAPQGSFRRDARRTTIAPRQIAPRDAHPWIVVPAPKSPSDNSGRTLRYHASHASQGSPRGRELSAILLEVPRRQICLEEGIEPKDKRPDCRIDNCHARRRCFL